MDDIIIWTCTYCHINPTAQSSSKCPRCGRKLTPWDLNKESLERKPEWPFKDNSEKKSQND